MTTKHTPAVAFANFKRTACPALDIDKVLYKGQPLPNRRLIEHRLVWNLFQFLAANDWIVSRINDGEDNHNFKGGIAERIKAAMELVFNLDECTMLFQLEGSKKTHWVQITLGNDGWDSISDHSYSGNDSDNFQAVMDDFDCESFIEAKPEDFAPPVDANGLVIGSAEHFAKWCSNSYLHPRAWEQFVKAYRETHPTN